MIIQDVIYPLVEETFPYILLPSALHIFEPYHWLLSPTNPGWIGEGRRELNEHSLNFSVYPYCHSFMMQLYIWDFFFWFTLKNPDNHYIHTVQGIHISWQERA